MDGRRGRTPDSTKLHWASPRSVETSRLFEGGAMVRQYRKFDEDFKAGAVRLVFETGKPIAQVARDLGINDGTLGTWAAAAGRAGDGGDGPLCEDERAELARLRRE